jgi:N-acetylglutamate synthase-like GNAT family acetyltransferase
MNVPIRQATDADAELLAEIISKSFADVALRFSLTRENCPKHPSNCTPDWIRQDQARGVQYFIAGRGDDSSGCVALERPGPELCYLERLAVLPDRRERGIGRALVEHVIRSAKAAGSRLVSLAIIARHVELREWYGRLGFRERETKTFPHLPFEVLFMEMKINGIAANSTQPITPHMERPCG